MFKFRGLLRHFIAPLIPGGLFLQSAKSQSLGGMVQSQEKDGGAGERWRKAVGIDKCCGCSEIWEPYFNTCGTHSDAVQGAAWCQPGARVGMCVPLTPVWQASNCIPSPRCRFLPQTVEHPHHPRPSCCRAHSGINLLMSPNPHNDTMWPSHLIIKLYFNSSCSAILSWSMTGRAGNGGKYSEGKHDRDSVDL